MFCCTEVGVVGGKVQRMMVKGKRKLKGKKEEEIVKAFVVDTLY